MPVSGNDVKVLIGETNGTEEQESIEYTLKAADVPIVDSGGNFVAEDIEEALAELSGSMGNAAYGHLYMVGNATNTPLDQNVPAKILGTTTAGLLENFTHANNRLTYTGTDTQNFVIIAAISPAAESNDKTSRTLFYKNGVLIPGAIQEWVGSTNKYQSEAGATLVTLAQNDYIEVWIENIEDNSDITVIDYNLVVHTVAGAGATGATGATGPAGPAATHRFGQTYAICGEIKVASGNTDFLPPFFIDLATGQSAKLVKARHKINSGTSVTCKLQKNDVDITGFTGISVTTTAANTDPADVTLTTDDKLALVVTAVAGTPQNLSFTIFIEVT